jgi:zinc D-Ala-D-Ala carboxypeptidase
MKKIYYLFICFFIVLFSLAGCNDREQAKDNVHDKQTTKESPDKTKDKGKDSENDKQRSLTDLAQENNQNQTGNKPEQNQNVAPSPAPAKKDEVITVVSQPESISVLVNKQRKLPDQYSPNDLETTTVPFLSSVTTEKRKLRSEAASALANLFESAKQQGINLLGVSGFRSHATQVTLFNYYVKRDGYDAARTYSALPGTSEHETGLSIDVTGGDGSCPAQDCFANKPEAKWLQDHVAEYGFIIRYPKGKESITGYQYEPWHIRYVGKKIATEIMSRGITLEEYLNAIPVYN